MSQANRLTWCDFCGKTSEFVRVMVASPSKTIHICDECIEVCGEITAAKIVADGVKLHVSGDEAPK